MHTLPRPSWWKSVIERTALYMKEKASVVTASWGQRAGNIARSNSTHGHSSKSHFDLCGWGVLHRSCVAEVIVYAVVPTKAIFSCMKDSTHERLARMTLAVGGQAKVLGKAAIGRQLLTNNPHHLSRSSSVSLSLCHLAYSSMSHLIIHAPELSLQSQ